MRKPVVIRERPHTMEELAKLYGVPRKRMLEIQQMVLEWNEERKRAGAATEATLPKEQVPAKRASGTRKKTTSRRSA